MVLEQYRRAIYGDKQNKATRDCLAVHSSRSQHNFRISTLMLGAFLEYIIADATNTQLSGRIEISALSAWLLSQ